MKSHLIVVAALIEKRGRVLICQRKRDDAFGLLWEFPGGKVEEGESFAQALRREIREELGIEIEPEELLGVFEDEIEDLKITVYLFHSRIKRGVISCQECNDFRFIKREGLRNYTLAPVDRKIASFLLGLGR